MNKMLKLSKISKGLPIIYKQRELLRNHTSPPYWSFDNFFAPQALNLEIITHFFTKKAQ